MKKITLIVVLSILFPTWGFAALIQQDKPLPQATVIDKGEIVLQKTEKSDDNMVYMPWSTRQLSGKVRVIHAIAGRSSAKEMNAPFIEAIKAAKFPRERYQTTTIINANDAIIGTRTFVRSRLKESKREFPWSQFIYDENGVVQHAWQLKPESSAIIILNSKGTVLFAKEGALTAREIEKAITLIKTTLSQ
ncbi:MAG: YtfJ family protein [Plesiomonas sp.]|uniref:YtfJ family protein n=1 Tax=Plesiomonas sp. TaxID=2486279 RepID=UPI003F2A2FFA